MVGEVFVESLIVIVSFLIFGFVVRKMNYPYGGTDHAYHYKLISYIKRNHHWMVRKFNENYLFVCPQLYHIICSFLSDNILLKRANFVNFIIVFLMFVSLNVFLVYCRDFVGLELRLIDRILVNGIFVTMPIFYAVWNAKFMGLSARALGCFLGILYLMILFFYLLGGGGYFFALLALLGFILLLSSQFGFQFYTFCNCFIALITGAYEVLLLIPLSACALFVLNFPYAKNFFRAQFNHKRNYSKFMIHGTQFKLRYSIWRDFVWDFWKNRDRSYFLGNPVIEILIGAFPSCCALVGYWFVESDEVVGLLYVVMCGSFFAFFVTSLRILRFLGEPQRYIEFGLPFASLLCVVLFPLEVCLGLIALNCCILWWYAKNSQFHRQLPEHIKIREEMLHDLEENFDTKYSVLLSNDTEIARHFYVTRYDPVLPNYCAHYENLESFMSNFYKGDYHRIAPQFLVREMEKRERGTLILYTNLLKFYDESAVLPLLNGIELTHIKDIGKFKIFRFSKT